MFGVFQNIDPPPPHRPARVYPPPPRLWCGGGHTRWVESGWGSIVRKTTDTALYSIYVSTLWCIVYQYCRVYSALTTLLRDSHWAHSVVTLLDFESKSGSAPLLYWLPKGWISEPRIDIRVCGWISEPRIDMSYICSWYRFFTNMSVPNMHTCIFTAVGCLLQILHVSPCEWKACA